jgi:hypothetical protein
MTRSAAHKLARLLRAQGYRVRVRRHAPLRRCCFYTVENFPIMLSTRAMVPANGE